MCGLEYHNCITVYAIEVYTEEKPEEKIVFLIVFQTSGTILFFFNLTENTPL